MQPDLDTSVRDREYVIFNADPVPVHTAMYTLVTKKIPFKVMLGSHKGVTETSFCVPHSTLPTLVETGLLDEQESILVLSAYNGLNQRKARIVTNANGEELEVGFFNEVSQQEAELHAGWTYDPLQGVFFIIEPETAPVAAIENTMETP